MTESPHRFPITGSGAVPLSSCTSLDSMIACGRKAKAACQKCKFDQPLDLVALRERVGGSYCLIDRRSKCVNCGGWVRFFYLQGIWHGMRTMDGKQRWMKLGMRL